MKTPLEKIILYVDIFLLTVAIGINSHNFYTWYDSPPPCEECGE